MTRYYLSKNYNGLNNAGNKAKTDIEETLSKLGYKKSSSILSRSITLSYVISYT